MNVVLLSSNAVVPQRQTPHAAGYDLCASADIVVCKTSRNLVDTGLRLQIPVGCYGRIAPRSGMAWKHSIDVGAGVIDSDYRGEVKVLLVNHGEEDYQVKVGDRVAQLIIEQIRTPDIIVKHTLDDTSRGADGFGSTGK